MQAQETVRLQEDARRKGEALESDEHDARRRQSKNHVQTLHSLPRRRPDTSSGAVPLCPRTLVSGPSASQSILAMPEREGTAMTANGKSNNGAGISEQAIDLLNRILEEELAGVVRYTHYS